MRIPSTLGLLFAALLRCSNAASLHLRSSPADKPALGVQPVKAPPVHTVLAKSSSEAHGNASLGANASTNSSSNSTIPFRVSAYEPAIGKVFALYYSSASGQKVTGIEARGYKALSEAPSDPVVFDPETGTSLARGNCKLRLTSHTTYSSDMRKYNLRMAEVAVCEQFFDTPCGPNAKGCEIEMFAPLPYDSSQEKDIGAGMALTAHSLLCKQRTEAWQSDSCNLVRDKSAIAAGLRQTGSGIKLRKMGVLTDLKMDATYELGFKEAVFATSNRPDYEESTHYQKKDDVLAWSRAPPEAVFCEDLSCLVQKFQKR